MGGLDASLKIILESALILVYYHGVYAFQEYQFTIIAWVPFPEDSKTEDAKNPRSECHVQHNRLLMVTNLLQPFSPAVDKFNSGLGGESFQCADPFVCGLHSFRSFMKIFALPPKCESSVSFSFIF